MKKKLLYISGVLAVIALAFYFIFRPKKSQALETNNSKKGSSGGGGMTVYTPDVEIVDLPSAGFPLKHGSFGREVLILQAYLNIKDGIDLELDGIFGGNTYAGVKNHNWNDNYTLMHLNEVNELVYQAYVISDMNAITSYLLTQGIQLV